MQISSSSYLSFLNPMNGQPAPGVQVGQPIAPEKKDPIDKVEISNSALGFSSSQNTDLTEEEQAQVKELKERDEEVRAHEAAHAAVGGVYASAPTYDYQTGPDRKRYAIGGEVKIDTAPIEGDPQATIDKMRQVQAAALAPAETSGQDRKVAAAAAAKMRAAEAELAAQKAEEFKARIEGKETGDTSPTGLTETPPVSDADTDAAEKPDEAPEQENGLLLQQIQQASRAYERVAAFA